jgi:hypothetical protein
MCVLTAILFWFAWVPITQQLAKWNGAASLGPRELGIATTFWRSFFVVLLVIAIVAVRRGSLSTGVLAGALCLLILAIVGTGIAHR